MTIGLSGAESQFSAPGESFWMIERDRTLRPVDESERREARACSGTEREVRRSIQLVSAATNATGAARVGHCDGPLSSVGAGPLARMIFDDQR
jgi:hypothetical protein